MTWQTPSPEVFSDVFGTGTLLDPQALGSVAAPGGTAVMSKSLYVATLGPSSGKSLVVLGVMEAISRRVDKVGFFRPVIRGGDEPDNDIQLIRRRYVLPQDYESLFAVTYQQAHELTSHGGLSELSELILSKFKTLESQCDFVICEGTDFTGVSSAFEFDFNAGVANNLGCPVLIVANGKDKSPEEVTDMMLAARDAFAQERCAITASVVNRVSADTVDQIRQKLQQEWPHEDPVFFVPEKAAVSAPTITEIGEALDARMIYSTSMGVTREVLDYKIAAMHLPNFLDHVRDGSLVIAPGDRADIILGCLAIAYSESYPKIAGLILSGGLEPAPQVKRLMDGFPSPPLPILMTESDTYATAMRINSIRPVIAADNPRKIATALGVFESHVDLGSLERRIEVTRSTTVTPLMFEHHLIEQAKASRRHIVLPEGSEERILRASEILLRRGVADLTLLGNEQEIRAKITALGLDLNTLAIVDPIRSEWREEFARTYLELRRHKGITPEAAEDTILDVSYFATMMVHKGLADGMVSGSVHTTAHTIRPSFQIIKTREGCSIVSSAFFMCLRDRVLVYGDCAVNPNPDAEQLADIAIGSADTAATFGIEPRVAMLSYSTGQSGQGEDVERVKKATQIARQLRPELKLEGPIQYDAAIDSSVARTKLPESEVAGRATVFIFPDLNTGNNTYKAVQRSAGAVAVGPVLQGLNKPVNDLSRGCTVADIVNTVAITAIQAQNMA